ncbi:MAG: hypothetical protein GC162_15695 [Planctomycetes bacterium]|nr:hypothetical protein [Planctomycetota bacterium]
MPLAKRISSVGRVMGLVMLIALPMTAHGEDETDALTAMRSELAAMRQELARTQLELQKAQHELEEVRAFLSEPDAPKQIAEWKQQRQQWEEERKQIAVERKKLEAARAAMRDTTRVEQQKIISAPPPAVAVDPAAPRWDVDYKIAVIRNNLPNESIYIDPEIGEVLLERYPDIDHKHIMMRGTWQNRSSVAWRYTFEIRIADKLGRIIGHWRYQTPMLAPNELHAFEVKVPVTDVAYIERYQIGNIEPDKGESTLPAAPGQ